MPTPRKYASTAERQRQEVARRAEQEASAPAPSFASAGNKASGSMIGIKTLDALSSADVSE